MAEPTLLQQARQRIRPSDTFAGAREFELVLRYLEQREAAMRGPAQVPTETSSTTPPVCFDALDLDELQRLCDAAIRERYALFCEWWSDEKAQSEEAILAARELAERFRRGEVRHA